MKKSLVSKAAALVGALAMTFGFAACGQTNTADSSNSNTSDLKKVTFMLSWAPDTNHIGVYVAKNKGYFKDAGLDVDIVAVAQAGAADFLDGMRAGSTWGTHWHGAFESDDFRRAWLTRVATDAGHPWLPDPTAPGFAERRERMIDTLADAIEASLDVDALLDLARGSR